MALSWERELTESKYPAWNDLNYVVDSSNTAQPGFKVVCKVYVNASLVQTLNLYTYPGTTLHHINIARIVQNYITDTYQAVQSTPSVFSNQTLTTAYVTFQEYYKTGVPPVGGLQGSLLTSDTIRVWRGAFPTLYEKGLEWDDWLLNAGLIGGTGTLRMLTGFDNTMNGQSGAAPPTISLNSDFIKLKQGQSRFIRSILNSSAINAYYRLGLYDSTGTRTHDDVVSVIGFDSTLIYDFAIGIDDVESHSWSTGFTLDSDDKYMAIEITDAIQAQTYAYLFELDWTPCNAYTHFEVHWLNQYGGFDSWVFNRASKSTTDVIQQTHKVNPFDVSNPTPNPSARSVKPHFTQLTETIEMNTQNLKQWEYDGLKQILTSPEIYVKVSTPNNEYYVSAVVQDANTFRNYKTQDGIFNMNLKLKIDNSEQRQW